MQWSDASAFWAMGGYGLYVWGSFGVAVGILVAEPLLAVRRRRAALRAARADAAPEERAL